MPNLRDFGKTRATSAAGRGAATDRDYRYGIAAAISDALDPVRAPSKVRTLADMSPAERAEMAARYSPPTPKDKPRRRMVLPTAPRGGKR